MTSGKMCVRGMLKVYNGSMMVGNVCGCMRAVQVWDCYFFFNDPATTEIYTLSLHDALPISGHRNCVIARACWHIRQGLGLQPAARNRFDGLG